MRAATENKPRHVLVNGTQYVVSKTTITGKYVRELGGISAEEAVVLVAEGEDRAVTDAEELELVEGMEFRSVAR